MTLPLAKPRRVGVIIPASDSCLEAELPQRLAGAASVHFARVPLREVSAAALAAFAAGAYGAAEMLREIAPDLLVFGCTSGTFIQGAAWEAEFAAELSGIAGAPVITAAGAMVSALRSHGTRIRLTAPYTDDLIAAEVAYLTDAGFEITHARGLGIVEDQQISQLQESDLVELVKDHRPADATMISCTNVRTLGIEHHLVAAAGTPIVSSTSGIAQAIRDHLVQSKA